MIRVVIADDSAFMRKVLSDALSKQPDFEVVGMAANGKDAVTQVVKTKPDLVTMDVNMPVMDGLQALEVIMRDCPTPVLMFSSLTKKGADETIKALSLGAVDFMAKAGGSISRIDPIEGEFLEKCRYVSKVNIKNLKFRKSILEKKQETEDLGRISILDKSTHGSRVASILGNRGGGKTTEPATTLKQSIANRNSSSRLLNNSSLTDKMAKRTNLYMEIKKAKKSVAVSPERKLIALGTSTGGPRALQAVIPKLPADLPCGMVVVQHMPAGFTKSLAERLDSLSKVSVKEAEEGDIIKPGHVYIAPGNYHMTVKGDSSCRTISLNQEPPLGSHRPAVNILFDSVVKYESEVVSVIMTGMGCDGCEGMKKIKQAGGYIIAESEDSCVVYGMPKSVVDAGIADEVVHVQNIAQAIVDAVKK